MKYSLSMLFLFTVLSFLSAQTMDISNNNQIFSIGMEIKGISIRDSDLRKLDDKSYTSVQNTDDATELLWQNIFVSYFLKKDFWVVDLMVSRPFFWGNDNAKRNVNTVIIDKAILGFYLLSFENFNIYTEMGRKKWKTPSWYAQDFVFSDVIDMFEVVFTNSLFSIGAFLDFFSMNSPVDTYYDIYAYKESSIPYFNGDVNTYKIGLWTKFLWMIDFWWLEQIEFSFYGFYTRIGGVVGKNENVGGTELSRDGLEGNFVDNDWNSLVGLNLWTKSKIYEIGIQCAYSYGEDKKMNPYPAVNFMGGMFQVAGKIFPFSFLLIEFLGFYSEGGTAGTNGLWENYGFVSMKGDRVGGYFFQEVYGVYPSAIVDYDGINYLPFERSRRSGLMAVSVGGGITNFNPFILDRDEKGITLRYNSWFYWDTGSSKLNFNMPYSSKFELQKKLGTFMGIEHDLTFTISFNKNLNLTTYGSLFLSYDWYWLPGEELTDPYGDELAWLIGLKVNFQY